MHPGAAGQLAGHHVVVPVGRRGTGSGNTDRPACTHADVDQFCKNLYRYYANRGYWPWVARDSCRCLIVILLSLLVPFTLSACDWSALRACTARTVDSCPTRWGQVVSSERLQAALAWIGSVLLTSSGSFTPSSRPESTPSSFALLLLDSSTLLFAVAGTTFAVGLLGRAAHTAVTDAWATACLYSGMGYNGQGGAAGGACGRGEGVPVRVGGVEVVWSTSLGLPLYPTHHVAAHRSVSPCAVGLGMECVLPTNKRDLRFADWEGVLRSVNDTVATIHPTAARAILALPASLSRPAWVRVLLWLCVRADDSRTGAGQSYECSPTAVPADSALATDQSDTSSSSSCSSPGVMDIATQQALLSRQWVPGRRDRTGEGDTPIPASDSSQPAGQDTVGEEVGRPALPPTIEAFPSAEACARLCRTDNILTALVQEGALPTMIPCPVISWRGCLARIPQAWVAACMRVMRPPPTFPYQRVPRNEDEADGGERQRLLQPQPQPCMQDAGTPSLVRIIGLPVPWATSTTWALRTWVLHPAFLLTADHDDVHPSLLTAQCAMLIRARLALAGATGLAALPLTLPLAALSHAARLYAEWAGEGGQEGRRASHRQWSEYARVRFRELNEPSGQAEGRMGTAAHAADAFLAALPSPLIATLASAATVCLSSLLLPAAALALVNEEALVHTRIGGVRLLSIVAGMAMCLGVARSTASQHTSGYGRDSAGQEALQALRNLALLTHHFPAAWSTGAQVRPAISAREVTSLYPLRSTLFLIELIGAVTTPLLLLTWALLPGSRVPSTIAQHVGLGMVRDTVLGCVTRASLLPLPPTGPPQGTAGRETGDVGAGATVT